MKKFINYLRLADDRGTGLISTCIYLTVLLALFGWATDYNTAINLKKGIISSVKFAVLAGSQQVDQAQLTQGNLVINKPLADAAFLALLQKNLSLDVNLNPLPNSPVVSINKATIVYKAYNPVDLPAVSPIDGHIITRPTYLAYIEFDLKKRFTQILDTSSQTWTIRILKDASLVTP